MYNTAYGVLYNNTPYPKPDKRQEQKNPPITLQSECILVACCLTSIGFSAFARFGGAGPWFAIAGTLTSISTVPNGSYSTVRRFPLAP